MLEQWKQRQRERYQAKVASSEPRPAGQVSYVKVFLAVLFAGWILYALIHSANA